MKRRKEREKKTERMVDEERERNIKENEIDRRKNGVRERQGKREREREREREK